MTTDTDMIFTHALKAELDRLRTSNAQLLAACEQALGCEMLVDIDWDKMAVAVSQAKAAEAKP